MPKQVKKQIQKEVKEEQTTEQQHNITTEKTYTYDKTNKDGEVLLVIE